jgi:hypothetical protein
MMFGAIVARFGGCSEGCSNNWTQLPCGHALEQNNGRAGRAIVAAVLCFRERNLCRGKQSSSVSCSARGV